MIENLKVAYGTVTGTYITALADGIDPDLHPDVESVTGTVTITADPPVILLLDGRPVTAMSTAAVLTLKDGELLGRDGLPGARLLANDIPGMSPQDWSYTARFSFFANGQSVNRSTFSFKLGSDQIVDLTTVTPVTTDKGTPVIQGPRGEDGRDGTGVTIVGQVATAAQLPATALPGEGWLTGDGHLNVYVNGRWADVGNVRGPAGEVGPAGPASTVRGPKGEDGRNGTSITITGSVATVAELPVNGVTLNEGFIVQADGHLWLYDGTKWYDSGNVTGPKGDRGDDGADGVGVKGDPGEKGRDGVDAATFLDGLTRIAVVSSLPSPPVEGVLYILKGE